MGTIRNLAAVALAVVACSHAQQPPPPAPPQQVAEATPPPQAPAPAPAEPPARAVVVEPASIYFDFDSSDLSPQARATLQTFSDQAQKRPDQNLRVEGNCDERGSREYNLALGQRRAEAAKTYLVNLGLAATRIAAVSNGEERPRAPGHDDAAWSENRRDDLMPATSAVSQASR